MNTAANFHSHTLEKILEHAFVAGVGRYLWVNGVHDFEVLYSEVDNGGYDLVIEAAGFVRHIQLKTKVTGGKRSRINVHTRLLTKPSACVILLQYDPTSLAIERYHYFGGQAGEPMPDLGDWMVKHSRANAKGEKAIRPSLRDVPQSWFEEVRSSKELCCRLFGTQTACSTQ